MSGKVRLNVDMAPEMDSELEKIARKFNVSKSDIARSAIQLMIEVKLNRPDDQLCFVNKKKLSSLKTLKNNIQEIILG